jgi:hypothetical protein
LCMTVSHVPLQGAATGAQPVLQGAEQQWLVFLPKQPPASAEAASEQARTNDRTRRMRKHSYRTEEQLLRGATPGCGNHSPQFAPSCFFEQNQVDRKAVAISLDKSAEPGVIRRWSGVPYLVTFPRTCREFVLLTQVPLLSCTALLPQAVSTSYDVYSIQFNL